MHQRLKGHVPKPTHKRNSLKQKFKTNKQKYWLKGGVSLIYSVRGPGVRLWLAMAQTSSVRLAPCDQFRHFCPALPERSIHLPPSCRVPRLPLYLSAVPVGADWLLSTGTRHPKAGESLKSSAVVGVGSSNGTYTLSEALLGNTSF